ncbi:MAG: GDP-mannose 4,6-dehydratase [Anaerolineae bacterium]|nr:GDP-mannose 4,6-dehydratase [Anaerolineae bacterium]
MDLQGNTPTNHLINQQPTAELFGTIYRLEKQNRLPDIVTPITIDLRDEADVYAMLADIRPDAIYHLAAQSSPSHAQTSIWPTLETNIRSQLNLFETCIRLNIKPRTLITTSGEIYRCDTTNFTPLTEDIDLLPESPYALSKVTQDMMGLQYFISHKLPIIRARPFNHSGIGQRGGFVAPDFALQIAKIEAKLQAPVMKVGNLSAQRDFSDVRDVVRAYALLIEKGKVGEAYNIASNRAYSIQYVLDTLLTFTNIDIDVQIDNDKLRPVDVPIKQGDYSRLNKLTGWQPTIPFETTLRDLLEDCRQRIANTMRSK